MVFVKTISTPLAEPQTSHFTDFDARQAFAHGKVTMRALVIIFRIKHAAIHRQGLLALWMFVGFSGKADAAPILRSYWEAALKNDADIQGALVQKRGSEEVLRSVPSYFSPRLNASGVVQKQDALVENKVFEPLGIPEKQQFRAATGTATVDLSQDIYNNPITYERSIAQREVERGATFVESIKRDKLFRMVQVFFEAMRLKSRIQILSRNRKLLNEQRKVIATQLKARLRTKKDLERYNMLIDQRQLQINQTLQAVDVALFELARITRLSPILIPSLVTFETEKLLEGLSPGKDDIIPPAIRFRQAEISLLNERIYQTMSTYEPNLALFMQASYVRSLGNNIPLDPQSNTLSLAYGLRLNWIIWDSDRARINQSRLAAELKNQNFQIGTLLQNNALEKKQFQKTFERSKASILGAKKLIRSSNFLLQVAEAEADAGLSDFDLAYSLKATNADNELALVDSVFANINAWVGLANQNGKLNLSLVDSMDKQWFKDPSDFERDSALDSSL